MGNIQSCINASNRLYDLLENEIQNNPKLIELGITLESRDKNSYCFRVIFESPKNLVHAISISYPPDAYGNRGVEYNQPEIATTIETAVIDSTNKLFYPNELGYSDVLRFDTLKEIVEEILRVGNFVAK